MVFGTILRKVGVKVLGKVAKKVPKTTFLGRVVGKAIPILETKAVRVITSPATTLIKPLLRPSLKKTAILVGAGALTASPVLRKVAKEKVKEDPSRLLLFTPAAPLSLGREAAKGFEKALKPDTTASDLLKAGGIAGLAAGGLVLGTKLLKKKPKQPEGVQLTSPIPTPPPITTAPDKKVLTQPIAGKIPTAVGKPVTTTRRKRKVVKPVMPRITVSPKTNVLVQNVINR